MTSRVTPTLGLCLAGAIAAGLALARPGSESVAVAADPTAPTTTIRTDGFGNPAPDAPVVVNDGAAAPAGAVGTIAGFAFDLPSDVAAGSTLEIRNDDGAPHTLTAADGSFDTGVIDGGETGVVTLPTVPGTYDVFCALHPSMTAQIVVS